MAVVVWAWLSLGAWGVLLPSGAEVVEARALPRSLRADRAIIMWVESPTRECPAGWRQEWLPMCAGSTRSCFTRGPTRASLVDTLQRRIVNTVTILEPMDGADSFDLPYRAGRGGPYRVRGRFGHTRLIDLRDYTGDGVAAEFALFDAETCSLLFTTLIGYDRNRDRLLQFAIHTHFESYDHHTTESTHVWTVGLFALKPRSPGHWRYHLDFQGSYSNPLAHIHHESEVWFDRSTQTFDDHTVETEAESRPE